MRGEQNLSNDRLKGETKQGLVLRIPKCYVLAPHNFYEVHYDKGELCKFNRKAPKIVF